MRKSILLLSFALVTTALPALPRPAPARATSDVVVFESSVRRFTGEPISLSLKDADVKNVLRTFAELTGLNVVADPAVHGAVTVELRDVPWDQALDVILRLHRLGWTLEGNVLYVAPLAVLAAGSP